MYYTLLKKSEKGQFRVILLKCRSEPYDVAFCSKPSQASYLLQNKKWFLPLPIRPHAPGRSLPYLLDLFSCSPPPCHVFPWCWLSKGLKYATPDIRQWLLLCPVARKLLAAQPCGSSLTSFWSRWPPPLDLQVLLHCSTSSQSACPFKCHVTFYLVSCLFPTLKCGCHRGKDVCFVHSWVTSTQKCAWHIISGQ